MRPSRECISSIVFPVNAGNVEQCLAQAGRVVSITLRRERGFSDEERGFGSTMANDKVAKCRQSGALVGRRFHSS